VQFRGLDSTMQPTYSVQVAFSSLITCFAYGLAPLFTNYARTCLELHGVHLGLCAQPAILPLSEPTLGSEVALSRNPTNCLYRVVSGKGDGTGNCTSLLECQVILPPHLPETFPDRGTLLYSLAANRYSSPWKPGDRHVITATWCRMILYPTTRQLEARLLPINPLNERHPRFWFSPSLFVLGHYPASAEIIRSHEGELVTGCTGSESLIGLRGAFSRGLVDSGTPIPR
jgi:hypothetical protein